MRTTFALTSLAALAFASAASATPLSVERISYSPEFQTSLNDDYGPREGVVLQNLVTDAVNGALTRRGANLGARHIWWNFVSSRKERIEQAKEDWKAGRFGTVPGDDKEFIPLPDH